MPRPFLSADAGEGFPHDAGLMPFLDRVSVACGGHAGSLRTMRATVALAARHGVRVGAHVSYPDRKGFGRRELAMPPSRLRRAIRTQARALLRVLRAAGLPLDHVKPHGALYHAASRDLGIALAVGREIRTLGPRVSWIGFPGSRQERVARRLGVRFFREAFADRRYRDGALAPRSRRGALLKTPAAAVRQVRLLLGTGRIAAFCVHSDTPGCVRIARAVRRALDAPGGRR